MTQAPQPRCPHCKHLAHEGRCTFIIAMSMFGPHLYCSCGETFFTAEETPADSPLQIILLQTFMRQNLNEQMRLNGRWTTREQVSDAVAD